jgi:hypothetical protein
MGDTALLALQPKHDNTRWQTALALDRDINSERVVFPARQWRTRLNAETLVTVVDTTGNPQGLRLQVKGEGAPALLEEVSRQHKKAVVVWRLADLEERLRNKHRETFWIRARSVKREERESFELLSVTHTRNPVDGQFARLLDSGSITVDHQISALPSGGAHE